MRVGIVGSRSYGACNCQVREGAAVHPEDCPLLRGYLTMLGIVTRLTKREDFEGVVTGGAPGADTLAEQACGVLGVPCEVLRPKKGPEPFAVRAKARNTRIVEKVDMLIALYAPGPRSPGTTDTVTKARQKGIPVHVWHEGKWS